MCEPASPPRPAAEAVASLEAFVRTVTGSSRQARRAASAARARVRERLRSGTDGDRDDRELLFAALCEQPSPLEIETSAIEPGAGALPWRLAELTPALRLPWALRECGGWSEGWIARACGATLHVTHAALAEAERTIEHQVASDVLIVGEQPVLLLELRRLLAEAGHTIVGVGSTHARAISLAARSPPDLVVADIERAGSGGTLSAVRALEGRLDVPFVLLRDTLPSRTDTNDAPMPDSRRTLLKPCDPDEVRRVCTRALLFDTRAERARRRRGSRPPRL